MAGATTSLRGLTQGVLTAAQGDDNGGDGDDDGDDDKAVTAGICITKAMNRPLAAL